MVAPRVRAVRLERCACIDIDIGKLSTSIASWRHGFHNFDFAITCACNAELIAHEKVHVVCARVLDDLMSTKRAVVRSSQHIQHRVGTRHVHMVMRRRPPSTRTRLAAPWPGRMYNTQHVLTCRSACAVGAATSAGGQPCRVHYCHSPFSQSQGQTQGRWGQTGWHQGDRLPRCSTGRAERQSAPIC